MEYLPYDMYMEMAKYISVKDLFHMLMVSSNINKMLKDNIDDIIYTMSPPVRLNLDNHYLSYERGKSYDWYDANIKDMTFELGSFDKVLYHGRFIKYSDNIEIIIVLNINLLYTVYSFRPEVGYMECTPDYYGFDDDDYDVNVLGKKMEYEHIQDITIDNNLIDDYNYHYYGIKIQSLVHNQLLKYPFIQFEDVNL